MTREDALKLIPPGWVESDRRAYNRNVTHWFMNDEMMDWVVYAIPAPKPEPRRVPVGEMVVQFNDYEGCGSHPDCALPIRKATRNKMYALSNTKWRLDFDTREWVEVLE